jgi:hypothetical protein
MYSTGFDVKADICEQTMKLQLRNEQTRTSIPVRWCKALSMNTHLRKDHEELLVSLVGGKLPRNLTWSVVIDLIGQIGEVQPYGNDEFAFLVGSQRGFFKKPSAHNLEIEEISRLRKFLKEAGVFGQLAKDHQSGRMVVVIDHHAAHIYHDLGGSMPAGELTVKPYDPFGFHHHLIHRHEAHYKGDHVPEEDSYYDEIAKDLVHAEAIILIGHSTGKSNAAEFLKEYLKTHHPEIF